LLTSLRYAIFSIVVSSIVGLLGASAIVYGSSRYQFVNLITSIPIVLSAVTLGLGLIITFDVNPIDWRGSWLMMPIAHCLVAIPIVIRIISPVLRDLPNDLRDASRTLGATTWQMWRTIDLRIITPALITAAAIACAISLGEFGASSFLVRRNNETLPLTISRLLSRPGDSIQAQAYAISTLLIVVCIGIIAIVDYRDSNERGV
jgi:thiamine transport system permease protein